MVRGVVQCEIVALQLAKMAFDPVYNFSDVNVPLNLSSHHLGGASQPTSNVTISGLTTEVTKYMMIIIMLSVVVILAIAFVLFGLFMKAHAFTRTDVARTHWGRRHSFAKTDINCDAEGPAFGPGGFGGFDD